MYDLLLFYFFTRYFNRWNNTIIRNLDIRFYISFSHINRNMIIFVKSRTYRYITFLLIFIRTREIG